MAIVQDYRTWTEYNKYSKTHSWHGWAKVDVMYDNPEQLEEAVQQCYELHRQRWDKVLKKTKLTPVEVHSQHPNLVFQLDEVLAGDLREVYGKKRSDASDIYQARRIDMVKAAEKLGFTPGQDGWEQAVVTAIEEGRIK